MLKKNMISVHRLDKLKDTLSIHFVFIYVSVRFTDVISDIFRKLSSKISSVEDFKLVYCDELQLL